MTKERTVNVLLPERKDGKPITFVLGGSKSDDFNVGLLKDVIRTFWTPSDENPQAQDYQQSANRQAVAMLRAIGPQNELEGMFAAQIVAAHAAAMESHRRAAIPSQTFEGRDMNAKLAVKASRAFVQLTESLEKLRGKTGHQSVHVHHHHHQQDNRTQVAAQNAVVNVSGPQGEGEIGNERQPHEPDALPHQPGLQVEPDTPLRSEEPAREAVPSPGNPREGEV